MRFFIFLAAFAAFPVQADLYRWIDRETGSVKFSNTPPPWYGDPEKARGAPAVEVIPYRAAAARKPAAPEKPAAAAVVAALEARWTELVRFFGELPPSTDFSRAGSGIRQQIEAYQALSAELDRIDPAGAARRRAQDAGVLETIRRGLEAQFSPQFSPKPTAE
jgi:hypothetical protein